MASLQTKPLTVAAIQSCYIPWRGYFDFIASVDAFVIYDDVQYSTGSWRNRNKVKTADGLKWITVPVSQSLGMAIDQVALGRSPKPWKESHRRLLHESLGAATHFKDALALWDDAVAHNDMLLTNLNVRLLKAICGYLGISTPLLNARDFELTGEKTERLIQLLTKMKATRYVSGPAARSYIEENAFINAGIGLDYKTYDYPVYPQLWGAFEPAVTILDLIANVGPTAKDFIRSSTPNIAVVSSK
jgi:hypothetical protein